MVDPIVLCVTAGFVAPGVNLEFGKPGAWALLVGLVGIELVISKSEIKVI